MKIYETTSYTEVPFFVFNEILPLLKANRSITVQQLPPAAKALYTANKGARLRCDPDNNKVLIGLPTVSESFDATITREDIDGISTILTVTGLIKTYDPSKVAPIIGPWLFLKYGSLGEALRHSAEVEKLLKVEVDDRKYIFKHYQSNAAQDEANRTYGDGGFSRISAGMKTINPWPEVDIKLEDLVRREANICVAELACGEGGDLYSIALLVETGLMPLRGKVVVQGIGYGLSLPHLYNLAQLKRTNRTPERELTLIDARRPEARSRTIQPSDFFRNVEGGRELDVDKLKHVSVEFHPVFANIYDRDIFDRLVSSYPIPHIVCRTDLERSFLDKATDLKGLDYTITH